MRMDGFQLFKQGAEGRIYKGVYLGQPAIVKERFVKKYRHPQLDEFLTKERIKSECRAILRCKNVQIRTPTLYLVDFERRAIFMEYFEHSVSVKDFMQLSIDSCLKDVAQAIGTTLGRMHTNNIIHGDLTTSNMLLVNKKNESDFSDLQNLDLVFIDFGLAHIDSSSEDKAVDLYVLERALDSTHINADVILENILQGYQKQYGKGCKEVFAKYEDVRARGRKRTMVG